MSKPNRLVATLMAIAAVAVLPTAALAAPAPFEGLRASCPGIGDTTLTAPGNGLFTPGFIEGTNDLLVPYIVDVIVSGPDGSAPVNGEKAAPLPDDAVTCTIDATLHIGGVTYTIAGSLTGVVVGQP
jgi:hypothetical protein